jgi:glycosyltransferase involved in cell wall biosynthesis
MPYYTFPPFSLNVRKVAKQADIIIAITKRAKRALLEISVPSEKIRTIYPGIDTEMFSPARSRSFREVLRILYVGRIDREKGLDFLLKAFARLAKRRKDVELWLCGISRNPELGQEIREYSKRYPVKNLGFVKHDKLVDVYRECDVFCLPSFDRWKFGMKVWEEQFGFALVEAMACGLPIVATNCGAIPEVIGPDNFIVDQRSVEGLYSSLQTILADEQLRARISRSNLCRAREYFDRGNQTMQFQNLFATMRS